MALSVVMWHTILMSSTQFCTWNYQTHAFNVAKKTNYTVEPCSMHTFNVPDNSVNYYSHSCHTSHPLGGEILRTDWERQWKYRIELQFIENMWWRHLCDTEIKVIVIIQCCNAVALFRVQMTDLVAVTLKAPSVAYSMCWLLPS